MGSSKKITELPPTSAIQIDNFLFCPPDKLHALVVRFLTKSKSLIIFVISLSIFSLGTDLNTQNISKCSSTVKSSNKTSC